LSIQRGIQTRKPQQEYRIFLSEEEEAPASRSLYKRDPSIPLDDTRRITHITYSALLIAVLAALDLYIQVSDSDKPQRQLYAVPSSTSVFLSYLYTFMLTLISRRHPLPNTWGWILNVHLCIIYTVSWLLSLYQFYQVVIRDDTEDVTWFESIRYLMSILLSFDLMYVSAAAKQGPPFLDRRNQPVCNINVDSILGHICFFWPAQIVHNVANKKSGEVTDEDLPRLTPTFLSRNIFHLFGVSRGKADLLLLLNSMCLPFL
jgi:hypothetical protein